jgi:hypothetical protein
VKERKREKKKKKEKKEKKKRPILRLQPPCLDSPQAHSSSWPLLSSLDAGLFISGRLLLVLRMGRGLPA